MSIKAGQILFDAYGFIIDRIQTGGATSLNIPEEKVYEVGNFNAVGIVRDSPDLSFDLETFDSTTELESLLTFIDPLSVNNGDMFDLSTAVPMDIISPIKDAWKVYTSTHGVVIPYLTLESCTYRFELKGNHSQRHTLRGDSYFFVDSPVYEEYAGDGATTDFAFSAGPAQAYRYNSPSGQVIAYALGVSVVDTQRVCSRLFMGDHYSNTPTGIKLLDPDLAPAGSTVRVTYGAAGTTRDYPQSVNSPASANIDQGVAPPSYVQPGDLKPSALRGRNIDVYIGSTDATPVFSRWTSVQSAQVDFTMTLDKDEEFGNAQYVAQDHQVPSSSYGPVTPRSCGTRSTRSPTWCPAKSPALSPR
jgi:hypothetical protein